MGLCNNGRYGYEDRISSLPDDIRCHILSFLPTTKSIASTSVLSRNWRYVWRFVPKIHLDNTDLMPYNHTSFEALGNQLLVNPYNPPVIANIYLHSNKVTDLFTINSWIQAAISRQVRQLDISFPAVSISYDMILSLCSCQTLEVLKICGPVDEVGALSFPLLKVLHLSKMSPTVMQRLYTGCPVLQELVLDGMLSFSDTTSYVIFIPTLKRLSVRFCTSLYRMKTVCNVTTRIRCEFRITTPAIECLDIAGPNLIYKFLVDMPFLRAATLDLERPITCAFTTFVELLNAMPNIHSLCLSPRTVYLLEFLQDTKNLPTYLKMTHLEIQFLDYFPCEMVIDLINGTPKLNSFVLKKEVLNSRARGFKREKYVPSYAMSLIKIIEIQGFNGRKDEQVFMSSLLKQAAVEDEIKTDSYKGWWSSRWLH